MTQHAHSFEAPRADTAPPAGPAPRPGKGARGAKTVSLVLGVAVGSSLLLGGVLVWHAHSKADGLPLTAAAKPVSVVTVKAKPFQPSRTYVGTLEPWLAANVGPQLVSAYIESVEVRPGAVVKHGDLLATLDCRDASAQSQAVAMEARAIDAQQRALAAEAKRLQDLLAKNFVSPNETQMKEAARDAEGAQLAAHEAKLSRTSLEVSDCVLRAPFDGEVATRTMDPGGFVRPGMAIVSVVDRNTVRLSVDVPEVDFAAVPPGTKVRVSVPATKQEVFGTISRRAPAADPATRTVHFEVDLPDPERRIPVGTTGEAHLDVGEPEPAIEIPLHAASVRGSKATIFVVEGDVAHARTVLVKGEIGGSLFVDPSLAAGTQIVTEGRALLTDGDRVSAKAESQATPAPAPDHAEAAHAAKEQKP